MMLEKTTNKSARKTSEQNKMMKSAAVIGEHGRAKQNTEHK